MDPMEVDGAADSEVTRSDDEYAPDDAETEEEEEGQQRGSARQRANRSRGSSPSASSDADAGDDDAVNRLTARQRARMEKESGMAQDVAWSQMELLPKLNYSYRGRGPKKAAGQMTEEEWLKHQEALERRRVRTLRDKREAEEAVKAKIRRAVTARMRGKLGPGVGDAGGLEGGADGGGGDQEGPPLKPGWVRMRYTADGVTVAWHAAAHPLSLPVPVVAAADGPAEPIDLPMQLPPPGTHSSSSQVSLGHVLSLLPAASGSDQHALLHCVDSQGVPVGCLAQQEVLDAMELAGCPLPAAQQLDWQDWRAVVRSVRKGSSSSSSSSPGVLVRLVPAASVA